MTRQSAVRSTLGRGLVVVLAAGLAGAVPAPVMGQVPSSGALSIAQCVVDNDLPDVTALLKALPGAPSAARAENEIVDLYGACADNQRAKGRLAWRERAELAHAAVVTRTAGRDESGFAAMAAAGAWQPEVPAAGSEYDARALGMQQLGACAVKAKPDAALRLVRSTPGSRAEKSAIAEIAPSLNGCLVQGQTIKLKRTDLRFLVAEPVFHILAAAG